MNTKDKSQSTKGENITRREALEKTGKYAAFTAAASLLLLTPRRAVANSIDATGGNWGNSGGYAPGGGDRRSNGTDDRASDKSFRDDARRLR